MRRLPTDSLAVYHAPLASHFTSAKIRNLRHSGNESTRQIVWNDFEKPQADPKGHATGGVRNPAQRDVWIPAFAGMTLIGDAHLAPPPMRQVSLLTGENL